MYLVGSENYKKPKPCNKSGVYDRMTTYILMRQVKNKI